jgi:hypothetical protein
VQGAAAQDAKSEFNLINPGAEGEIKAQMEIKPTVLFAYSASSILKLPFTTTGLLALTVACLR